MNQSQLKEILLRLKGDVEEFALIFSGKQSKKVDGLYKPESREIIIHNRNTEDQNAIIYTAIHEFAHHVHITGSPVPVSRRAHTKEYWSILHALLGRAEELDIYLNKFKTEPDFQSLTREIKENFIFKNGKLMKEFGKLLGDSYKLCIKHGMSFDDYVDRELGLGRTAARQLISVYREDINPQVGYENMKTLTRIKPGDNRNLAEEAFLNGSSPDTVKSQFAPASAPESDPAERLLQEKHRIEKSIASYNKRLAAIEKSLSQIGVS